MSDINTNDTLALKYRPKRLEDLAGHKEVVSVLKGLVKSKKVPNAIAFVGPSGIGKTTLSRMIARYINCETWSACGKCTSCKQMDTDTNPDYKEVNGAETGGKEDMIRLIGEAKFAPRNNCRIIMIDEVHRISLAAANSILKPLEEPPANTMWILATTDPEKIPNSKAVLGRCSVVYLKFPTKEDISSRLMDVAKAEKMKFMREKVADEIAEASGGHVRDALQILDNVRNFALSNEGLKGSKLRKAIREQAITTASDSLDEIVLRALLGIYKCDPKLLVAAVFDVSDDIGFINKMMYANQFLVGVKSVGKHSKVWWTPFNRALLNCLKDKKCEPDLVQALSVHAGLVALRSEMQAFSVDGNQLMLAKLPEIMWNSLPEDEEEDDDD